MPENNFPEQLVQFSREISRKHAGTVVSVVDNEAYIRVNVSDGSEVWRLLVNRPEVRAYLKSLSTGDNIAFQIAGNYLTYIRKINQNELESVEDERQVNEWANEPRTHNLSILVSESTIKRLREYADGHGITVEEIAHGFITEALYDEGY